MAVSFKGAPFPKEIILTGVRWYVAYPLSTRHVEALLRARGVSVGHATINRWVITDSPQLEAAFHRRKRPAKRFLTKAIRRHGIPEQTTIDGSGANAAVIRSYNKTHGTAMVIRQVTYLNNIIEQDHRGVKRVSRPMLGFKSFEATQATLTGLELMHMVRKGQLEGEEVAGLTAAEQLYALAA